MKYRSYNAKRDANEPEIVAALQQVGASVVRVSVKGLADLIVGYRNTTYLIEVKTKKGKLTKAQIDFRLNWRGGPIVEAKTVDEALRAIDAI